MFSQEEVNKFNDLAHEWWNPDGVLKTLHHINPARLEFIKKHVNLSNATLIDVGCGGGIFAESLAHENANVTAIDLAPQSIEIAKLHLYESNLEVNYECIEIGEKAKQSSESFDVLTCMEMLEHVPSPEYIIAECAKLLKDGGIAFFSTLNRNLTSYALGVVAAEYILNLVPKGTHDYKKFITPSELRQMLKKHGLEIIAINGMDYNPFSGHASLSNNAKINYLIACKKISSI
ncbi:MAG: bifunctional 2-polyprenyl-6-hydroxyphenol methylase/3-demethylubiquinol 3-O-methyltransferase UbiG [Burkholderiales bacterium]|nr:bifunctional 2-polyprenyl-6-hydroxyphenol methylase/3-demethylubiquinol 3-O-methyltransferase UbiG [Burkholderiales bacterium]